MLKEMKLTEFFDSLAAKTPTPGGGSAGALAGAVGTALGLMSLRYSKLEGDTPEGDLESLRGEFTSLIDRDTAAYDKVTAAFKLPKGNDDEKKARRAAIQTATIGAAEVPLEGVERCASALEHLLSFAPRSNKNLSSDLASGAIFLKTAAQVMARNVVINVMSIKDEATAGRLKSGLESALARVDRGCADVLDAVEKLDG